MNLPRHAEAEAGRVQSAGPVNQMRNAEREMRKEGLSALAQPLLSEISTPEGLNDGSGRVNYCHLPPCHGCNLPNTAP